MVRFRDIFKKWYFYVVWAVLFFFQWLSIDTFYITDIVLAEVIGLLTGSFIVVLIVWFGIWVALKVYEILNLTYFIPDKLIKNKK